MIKRVTSFLLAIVLLAGFVMIGSPVAHAASEMTASDDMITVLKQEEGFSSKPYWDYAQYTVGYGTACPKDMVEYYTENGITEEEAETLLRNYLANTENTINKMFIDKYGLTLTQNQFDALVSLTYNCGSAWIYETTGTLHNAVKNGTTGSELIRAFSLWCSAGGKILPGLVRRRLSEANMFLNGQYSRTAPDNYCYVYYNPNGGSVSYKIQGYDSNLGTAPAYTPSYSGRTFLGWFTEQVGGTQVTTLTQDLSGDTLYAHWSEPVQATEPETDTNPGETTDATAPTEPKTVVVTVTGRNVRLRSGPGTNYGIIGMVTVGDRMQISEIAEGSGYTWGRAYKNWICLDYTNYDEVVAQMEQTPTTAPETTAPETTLPPTTEPETTAPETTVPPTTEPETTAPETTAPAFQEVTVTVTGRNVRLRSGPGTGYSIIGMVTVGDRMRIMETVEASGYTWGRAYKNWICLDYTNYDKVAPQAGQTPTTPPETTAPETTVPETTVPPTTEPETTAPETAAPETTDPAAQEVTVTVTGKNVRLRSGPGTSYSVIGMVTVGDRMRIMETAEGSGYRWGRAYKNWICLDYTDYDAVAGQAPAAPPATEPAETTPPAAAPETGTTGTFVKTVNTSCLRIRSSASSSASIVGYVYRRDRLTIFETVQAEGTTWGRSYTGWVCMDYMI